MQYENLFLIKRFLKIIFFVIIVSNVCFLKTYSSSPGDYTDNDHRKLLFDDTDMQNYLEETTSTKNGLSPLDILTILNEIQIINILKIPFFLQTDSLFTRSILDLPMIDTTTYLQRKEDMMYLTSLFLEKGKTGDEFFQKYLNLRSPELIEAIENTFSLVKDLLGDSSATNFNIDRILELIAQSYVEQRIAAVPLFISRTWKTWCFRFATSLEYIEKNFFLTENEKQLLIEELDLAQSSDDSFTEQHLVSDKIGITDIRLEAEKRFIKGLYHSTHLGFYTVLPTSFPFKKGIFGTTFRQPSTFPPFDFNLLFDFFINQDTQSAIDFFSKFFLDASDRLAADLLTTQLGNFPHVALGVYVRMKSRLSSFFKIRHADRVIFKNHIEFEYLTPATQKVFYITKTDPNEFNQFNIPQIIADDDVVRAAEAVNFIERKIVENFFLRAFKTLVQPGIHFRWSSAMIVTLTGHSKLVVGSDYFYKARDHIININVPYDIKRTLDTKKAVQKSLSVTTLFGKYIHSSTTLFPKSQFSLGVHVSESSSENGFRGWGITVGWKVEF